MPELQTLLESEKILDFTGCKITSQILRKSKIYKIKLPEISTIRRGPYKLLYYLHNATMPRGWEKTSARQCVVIH